MKKSIYGAEHKFIIERLKEARQHAGLKQEEVARRLNRPQSYVSRIESGQVRIEVLQLTEFARIYKKKLEWFVRN